MITLERKTIEYEDPRKMGHFYIIRIKPELRKYLKEKLKEKGYSDEIEIITEW